MKQLKKDLDGLTKDLKRLQKKTEQMAKRLRKLEMSQRAKTKGKAAKKVVTKKRPGKKSVQKRPGKKSVQPTGIDLVFSIIKRSKKGVGTDKLKMETGFDRIKVFNTINALKTKGMIKSAGRGIYMKA
ncbi:MAG: hypothetical protein P8012_08350 [Desulfobacterales bacterium]